MIGKLDKYYRQQGIHPLHFSCKHYKECKSYSNKFTEAKATFIGTEYAKATLPRLLILSLDAFNAPKDPTKRSFRWVRKITEQTGPPKKKNAHWYRTFETAQILLQKLYEHKFNNGLGFEDVGPFFAHVNSAKCCAHQIGHKQANNKLFKNCREYISKEIELLEPDIIVTQGKMTRKAIEDKFEVIKPSKGDINTYPCGFEIVKINWKRVFVFHTFHPSNYGNFHNQRKKCFDKFSGSVYKQFVDK
ncbi:MAG: uracil-DNA glycosylase family protein [Ignavibacteriaceae bacterium]|nr:uracil-DNA glycosylase family protein [Ignavibacteriaceae bacterium]